MPSSSSSGRTGRPSTLLSAESFDNAVITVLALGGSTNAVIHLIAMARRAGVELSLDRFDELSRSTPVLADIRPGGRYLMEDFYYAGGLLALLAELRELLNARWRRTVGDGSFGEAWAEAQVYDREVIRPLEHPVSPSGALAILHGSLAPDGAVIKAVAADPALLRHRGHAVTFEDHADLEARIDDPDLPVTPDSVLVLKRAGPVGAPGMPEWGMLPIPRRLLEAGVRDMVRISDARMSGTSYGTCVLHVAPESAVGGPLAFVRDGDEIELDVAGRRLDLLVAEEELARRRADFTAAVPTGLSGYGELFVRHVTPGESRVRLRFPATACRGRMSR